MADVEVTVRQLARAELDFYLEHLMRLDGHARAQRFAAGVDDHFVLSHCLRLVTGDQAVIGAFVGDYMRGSAELDWDMAGEVGEVSLAVERPWRRQGFAHRLMAGAVETARERNIRSVRMDAPTTDQAIARIARVAGFQSDRGRISRTYTIQLSGGRPARGAAAETSQKASWNPLRWITRPV